MYEEVIIEGEKYISVNLYAEEKRLMLEAAKELEKTLSGDDLIILHDIIDVSSLVTLGSFANAYMYKFFALCLNDKGVDLDHGSDELKIKVAKDVLLDFLQKEKKK
jgi:hypothetical protein